MSFRPKLVQETSGASIGVNDDHNRDIDEAPYNIDEGDRARDYDAPCYVDDAERFEKERRRQLANKERLCMILKGGVTVHSLKPFYGTSCFVTIFRARF